jgi:hypothetical protein
MTTTTTTTDDPPGIPKERPSTTSTRSTGPMTQSKYLEMQSIVREVIDPNGRVRTMRGTGEVIERIVSREEHARLNWYATSGDGSGYVRDIARAAAAASHAWRG